jgi:hypothetical protein
MGGQISAIAADAGIWFEHLRVLATSWLAWRIYAATAVMLVMAISIWIAHSQQVDVLELRPFRGKKPTKRESIQKRLDKLQAIKGRARATNLLRAGWVLLFGFIVPSIMLAGIIHFYSWFQPNVEALVHAGCHGGTVAHPSLISATMFMFSQLAMGASGIAADISSRSFGTMMPSYLPSNTWFAEALAIYRYFIGAFSLIFVRLLIVAFKVSSDESLTKMENELLKALSAAT